MCSSKPRVPDNKTPPAPDAPEPGPRPLEIGERRQFARSRGIKIDPVVDLSGLGNQIDTKKVKANPITINVDQAREQERLEAERNRPKSGRPGGKFGGRR